MALKPLTLAELAHAENGMIADAFDLEMEKALADLYDRPYDKRPRTLSLKVTLKPDALNGDLDAVRTAFTIDSDFPKKQSRELVLIPQKTRDGRRLLFSTNTADARQRTFDNVLDEPATTAGERDLPPADRRDA